jgi:hypothetical protein
LPPPSATFARRAARLPLDTAPIYGSFETEIGLPKARRSFKRRKRPVGEEASKAESAFEARKLQAD